MVDLEAEYKREYEIYTQNPNSGDEKPETFLCEKVMDIAKTLKVKLVTPNECYKITRELVSDSTAGVYIVKADCISVRNTKGFTTNPDCTFLHELIHWSGKETRSYRKAVRDSVHRGLTLIELCTEEMTAQIGMYHLSQILNIHADKSTEYLMYFSETYMSRADGDKAAKDAKAAVDWILKKL